MLQVLITAISSSLLATSGDDAAARPWIVAQAIEARYLEKRSAAKSDADRLDGLRFCLDAGLYPQAEEMIASLGATGALPVDVAARVGLALDAGKLVASDAARFTEVAPPIPDATLTPPTGAARADLLATKNREFKLRAKSTHFDLWSDLADADLVPWTKLLNDYYAGFRNRFSAYVPTNIDVFLFASHSDYLVYYALSTGVTGESVLGFYDFDRRLLTFFNDPFARAEIAITARHECTHLLIDLSYKGVVLPSWFHEGMACFLAADGTAARGEYTASLILNLMRPKSKANLVTLGQLLDVDTKDVKFEHYPPSWSLVHYLSASKRAAEFQKFQSALRDWAGDLEKRPTPAEARKKARELFEKTIECTIERLDDERRSWFAEQFRFERPEQFLDFAAAGTRQAEFAEAPDEARFCLDAAHQSLDAIASDASSANERTILSVAEHVRRAELAKCDPDGARLLLLDVRDRLKALAPIADESRRARLVRRVLAMVATATSAPAITTPRDLRAHLAAKVKSTSDVRRQATLRSLVALTDDVLGIAFGALARALNADPRNRPAAREWLFLALEDAPAILEEVFPLLVLMDELDPDDESLAALALAYRGLGKTGYGEMLLDEAKGRSAQPGALSEYLRFTK